MNQTLKIYFTSDVHGYFFSTSYASREEQNRGLLKCASGFEKDGNTLVMDAGDILQGSAYTYYCQSVLKSNESIAKIMNQCGYDVITFGNHDFNYGVGYLEKYLDELNADAVCQNVLDENQNHKYPYVLKIMENGLKVGIVGIVTDFVNVWEKSENLDGVQIVDPFMQAKQALEELKEQADITICLYHGGFERDLSTKKLLSESTENVAYRICEELGFDLLLTGHQHMSIEGQYVNGTFVVQPKENATQYHEIMVKKDSKGLDISSKIGKPENVCALNVSEEIQEIERNVQDWLDNIVGKLDKPLLPQDKITMASDGNYVADFLNQIQLLYSGAKISAVSLANEISGFRKEVSRRDIIATYPYPNTLVVFEMTGKDLKSAIERSAEYFDMNDNGELIVSKSFLEPKVEHYNYDFYSGLVYHIDPSKPCGQRVVECLVDGVDLADDDRISVCVNNYRASGAGGYPMYPNSKVLKEINIEMVDLIMGFFEEQQGNLIEVNEPSRIMVEAFTK